MSTRGNPVNVWDGMQDSTKVAIDYIDLIGQPTWIAQNEINVKTVMRSDIWSWRPDTLPHHDGGSCIRSGGLAEIRRGLLPGHLHGCECHPLRRVPQPRRQFPDGSSWCAIIDAVTHKTGSGHRGAAPHHHSRRCKALVPAALFTRPQPH
jgi:hypothetical protein